MAYAYAKPPVYYYQTIDRKNLQFTNYPVFSVHTPQSPPPDSTAEPDGQVTDEQHGGDGHDDEAAAGDAGEAGDGGDGDHGDEAAADDVGEVGDGTSGLRSESHAG